MQDETILVATPAWRSRHAGASAAVLAVRLAAPPMRARALDDAREQLERELRLRYGGLARSELRATGNLPA
ncbi:MAG: hypothetical protein C4345_10090, partial [Chloroflexota bacterium]